MENLPKKKKEYEVSFFKVSFSIAFILGLLFLSLGAIRIYVDTLEKKLARIDSALTRQRSNYAESIYSFAVATSPEKIMKAGCEVQNMNMSFQKTATLHIPLKNGLGSLNNVLIAQQKTEVMPEKETSLTMARQAFLDLFLPVAYAQDER